MAIDAQSSVPGGSEYGDPVDSDHYMTGYKEKAEMCLSRERRKRICRNNMLTWRVRCMHPDFRYLEKVEWPNVRSPSRGIVELGPRGVFGRAANMSGERCHGSSALSDHKQLGDEDYAANSTWNGHANNRYSSKDFSSHPVFSYKKIWYSGKSFATGLYGFSSETYTYELTRLIARGEMGFEHLAAPARLVQTESEMVCHANTCPGRFISSTIRPGVTRVTLNELATYLTSRDAIHLRAHVGRILQGKGYRVSKYAWSADAIAGRFQWEYDVTQYHHDDAPRKYTTGGMDTEFDRRIAVMSEQENPIS